MQLLRPLVEVACHFTRLLPLNRPACWRRPTPNANRNSLSEFGPSPLPTQNANFGRSLLPATNTKIRKHVTSIQYPPKASTAIDRVSSLSRRDAAPSTQFKTQGQSVVALQVLVNQRLIEPLTMCKLLGNAASLVAEALIRGNFKRPCAAESQRPIFQLQPQLIGGHAGRTSKLN